LASAGAPEVDWTVVEAFACCSTALSLIANGNLSTVCPVVCVEGKSGLALTILSFSYRQFSCLWYCPSDYLGSGAEYSDF